MHAFFADLKSLVLDTLFPIECIGCKQEGVFLCLNCQLALPQVKRQHCIVCRNPAFGGTTHPLCQYRFTPDGLITYLDYRNILVSDAIIKGKYFFIPVLFELLGKRLAEYTVTSTWSAMLENFVIVPVPLSNARKRWRGFNQAEILAQELSSVLYIEKINALVRIKNTKTQKNLDKKNRKSNMSRAFAIGSTQEVKEKNILLVDDVVTTGTTMLEAAKTLKQSGAKKVWCAALSRD